MRWIEEWIRWIDQCTRGQTDGLLHACMKRMHACNERQLQLLLLLLLLLLLPLPLSLPRSLLLPPPLLPPLLLLLLLLLPLLRVCGCCC